MFSKATANLVRQVDFEGSLIQVSRVNDSPKLVPMALVVKRNRFWFWQKPKYQPTDFTLSDLLLGDEVITPEISELVFLTFEGTFGNQIWGKVEAEADPIKVELEGKANNKLHTCFGQLNKEELNVKKLWKDSRDRLVDMQHVLVQQLKKRAEVLAVVKERIFTTSSCSITQTKKDQCTFQGVLETPFKFCLKDSNNIEVDHNVSLEIPSGTVVAYSILELEIKKDGRCTICLRPCTIGGFEADSLATDDDLDDVDSCAHRLPENAPLSELLNGSQDADLRPLAELPESNRRVFVEKLQETLTDRAALISLQFVLEEMCNGETLGTENGELSENQQKLVAAVLDGARLDGHSGNGIPAQLIAAHQLVSAMEELPDETLNLLSRSSSEDLEALDMLMCRLKESSEPLSVHDLPVPLQDNQRLQLAERLFGSAKVTLRRDNGCLRNETEKHAGVLPLVLCLSVRGLALLCSGLK
ncbi:unnamed protein product [Ophioblennius macclurei]